MDGAAWAALGSFLTALLAGIVTGIIKLWNQRFVKERTFKKDTIEHFEKLFERLDRELADCRQENERKDKELYQLQKDCAEERRVCSIAVERREAKIRQLEELLTLHNIPFRPWISDGTDIHTVIGKSTVNEREKK